MENKKGQQVDRSSSGGRGVYEAWQELFEENARHWDAGHYSKIRTDTELHAKMLEWFPSRKRTLSNAARMRNKFNNDSGSVLYHRYLRNEKGHVCFATARGLPLSQWQQPEKRK